MKFLKSMPKEKLQKVILVAIVALIAVGALIKLFVGPGFAKLSAEGARVEKLKTELKETQAALDSEASNAQLRDRLKTFVTEQRQRMVSGDSFSWVVREVTLVAEKHPVRVSGMRPGTKFNNATKSRYEMFVTHVEADGTYDQVGAFLRDLENSFPTGELRGLELTANEASRGQCRVVFDIALPVSPSEQKAASTERKSAS
jgi:hypothetical protein